jgi:hypothetical protein
MLWLISACQGTTTPTGQSPGNTTDPIDRFPQTVGTSWRYAVEDTRLNLTDTVAVHIDKLVESTDTSRTWLWKFDSQRGDIVWPDFHVTIYEGSVQMEPLVEKEPWGRHNPLGRSVWLMFPLLPDSTWLYGGYESTVRHVDTLEVPLGTFATTPIYSFWITRCLSCLQSYSHWYVPDVGFVRIIRLEGVNGPDAYEIWELVDWDPEYRSPHHSATKTAELRNRS